MLQNKSRSLKVLDLTKTSLRYWDRFLVFQHKLDASNQMQIFRGYCLHRSTITDTKSKANWKETETGFRRLQNQSICSSERETKHSTHISSYVIDGKRVKYDSNVHRNFENFNGSAAEQKRPFEGLDYRYEQAIETFDKEIPVSKIAVDGFTFVDDGWSS